ncbi:hypothetical protein GCM10011515_15060 [Tsuneonella deserti]|uniref:LysR family transcriptional regulator n=1 Tax=Tsuneonella deserti TaxID=2035528 RepID=A0ABQ1S9U6_9SPHN|nr:hypothetical protein [Tsuneonella deserti]GGD96107.1 hypothetical protein GCM10011515_15060 [Tsuneonella deserti]
MNALANIPADLPAILDAAAADAALAAGPAPEPAPERSPALEEMTAFTRAAQAAFLAALAQCGSVRRAARASGISHQTAYRARSACPAFRRGWDAALLSARAMAEDVLATRALDGVEEAVFYRGELIATRRRYDSRLLLAHLARLDRLAEDAATDAFAGDFPAALARFEEGSDTPEAATPGEGADTAAPEAETPSPGQWSKRSTAPTARCPHCGGDCDEDDREGQVDCPAFPERLDAMEEARPRGAAEPDRLTGDGDRYREIEAEQLAAFEAGVERWWLVLPPGHRAAAHQDADGWWYCDTSSAGGGAARA